MAASITGTAVGRIRPSRMIDFGQHVDERGTLSAIEAERTVDFPIRRVYYMYDISAGAARGAHAHSALEQVVIAAHGSFTIRLDDGFQRTDYRLDHPGKGLYIGPMVWRDLFDFSPDGVCLVLASQHYDPADYYRDYDEFLRAV